MFQKHFAIHKQMIEKQKTNKKIVSLSQQKNKTKILVFILVILLLYYIDSWIPFLIIIIITYNRCKYFKNYLFGIGFFFSFKKRKEKSKSDLDTYIFYFLYCYYYYYYYYYYIINFSSLKL